MNWKEIKRKYPKAHRKFENWAIDHEYLGINEPFSGKTLNHIYYDNHDLYDFFDKQKIYITIDWYYVKCYEYNYNLDKDFEVKSNKINWNYCIRPYSLTIPNFETRPKAENGAFEKAFEILEEKIK